VGGSIGLETTNPIFGAKSLKQTRPSGVGNHGGVIESDYCECSQYRRFWFEWVHYSSAAGITNKVNIYWYKRDKTACATASTIVYNSASNPTTPKTFAANLTPPADARFFKVRLSGATADTDVAGTAYWDGLVYRPESQLPVIGNTLYPAIADTAGWVTGINWDYVYFKEGVPTKMRFSLCGHISTAVWTFQARMKLGTNYSATMTVGGGSGNDKQDIFEVDISNLIGSRAQIILEVNIAGVGSGASGWFTVGSVAGT